jgi:hypothetical protein
MRIGGKPKSSCVTDGRGGGRAQLVGAHVGPKEFVGRLVGALVIECEGEMQLEVAVRAAKGRAVVMED